MQTVMEQYPKEKATGISITGTKVKEMFREVKGHKGLLMMECSDGTIQGPNKGGWKDRSGSQEYRGRGTMGGLGNPGFLD